MTSNLNSEIVLTLVYNPNHSSHQQIVLLWLECDRQTSLIRMTTDQTAVELPLIQIKTDEGHLLQEEILDSFQEIDYLRLLEFILEIMEIFYSPVNTDALEKNDELTNSCPQLIKQGRSFN